MERLDRMTALIVIGILLVIVGAGVLWTGTAGIEWNSTHGRSLRRTSEVGARQRTFNTIVARIASPLSVILGAVLIVTGARR